jgi:hypothetical protein
MASLKCYQCGLVNFANAETCKRCKVNLHENSSSQSTSTYQPPTRQFTSTNADSIQNTDEESGKYAKKMIFGALWAVGGTIATIASYGGTGGGGKYVVFWGAILFGAVDFLVGFSGWVSNKD